MKIIGVCGSPRKRQTTFQALDVCMKAICKSQPDIETEIIELAGLTVQGCESCGKCMTDLTCDQDDDFTPLIQKLADRDVVGLVIASPVYLGSMTSQCKAFIDRTVMFRRNDFLFRNRLGGAIAVGGARNGGQELTIQAIHAAMMIQDMIIVGDGSTSSHYGGMLWNPGDKGVADDEIGLRSARNLGKRIADLAIKIHSQSNE